MNNQADMGIGKDLLAGFLIIAVVIFIIWVKITDDLFGRSMDEHILVPLGSILSSFGSVISTFVIFWFILCIFVFPFAIAFGVRQKYRRSWLESTIYSICLTLAFAFIIFIFFATYLGGEHLFRNLFGIYVFWPTEEWQSPSLIEYFSLIFLLIISAGTAAGVGYGFHKADSIFKSDWERHIAETKPKKQS